MTPIDSMAAAIQPSFAGLAWLPRWGLEISRIPRQFERDRIATADIQRHTHGHTRSIAPETILTERNKERIPAAQQAELVDAHPVRRLGTPDDVARAVLFLASDASSWITGVVWMLRAEP